ncbi:MAG: argininosuccinate lyase [Acidimicrobiales bacterium]|nr:MAG: argininosuccinate lyase [Acidimicrobiales bacterium]
MSSETAQLWGGRFATGPAPALAQLSRSVHFDWRLVPYDIAASRAHARVLHHAGVLEAGELSQLLSSLEELGKACETGEFTPTPTDEDVHTALERGLLERLGPLGGKLRAGRSRNDQIATELRLYLRDNARGAATRLVELCEALVGQSQRHVDVPAPGMTHLQHAQPVLFSHHLLAHVQAFLRDLARLQDWDVRAACCPLGAGALAGSSLPLNPEQVAAELGFDGACENSIDAVSDRDFAAEFLFITALIGVHLSRLGEEIVLWTSHEFGWITLDDAYATGSSIMPQKKNPDIAELARGKAGRLIGSLMSLLVTLKGLPLAYDRDLQEDKEPVFDAVDTMALVLPAMAGMVDTMTVNAGVLRAAAPAGYALATEVAEWLVRAGVPFRQAHEITGALVARCVERGLQLHELSDAELCDVSELLTPEVREVLTVSGAIAARTTVGSTGAEPVAAQLATVRKRLTAYQEWGTGAVPL